MSRPRLIPLLVALLAVMAAAWWLFRSRKPSRPSWAQPRSLPVSDLSVTVHNLGDLFAGKATFAQFRDGELALIKQNIASLPAPAQPAVTLLADSLAAGASALVGLGMTAVGPILNDTTDHQATMVLNLLQALGVPTQGPLSIAEKAIAIQAITGLKAGLDRIGLKITAPAAPAAAPAS